MRFLLLIFLFVLPFSRLAAQSSGIREVFPPYWWQGMVNTELQLLCHGDGIGKWTLHRLPDGFRLKKSKTFPNPNYLALELVLGPRVKAGTQLFIFRDQQGREQLLTYDIRSREKRTVNYGLDGGDFIYLLMPDRFANGDINNDTVSGMQEKGVDRADMWKRHGGDLAGMQAQLPYLEDMGVTAIWPTPVWENDQPRWSYHGYAVTDHYRIDPRLGSDTDYKKFVRACHDRNMRVVFDIVFNHIGDRHLFYRDIPDSSWFNVPASRRRTSFNTVALSDPYAGPLQKETVTRGWFDGHMPDLNQDNPDLARFLIQNCIWWVEAFGVDAFRVDTYPYVEQAFLTDWAAALEQEYPGFTVFAEVWAKGLVTLGRYAGQSTLHENHHTGLSGLLDFEWYWAVAELLAGGTGAAERLYITLSQDGVYGNPGANITFIGNHDLPRVFTLAGRDEAKFRLAATLLLTQRGIPQWFYGDEFLFDAQAEPLDRVRPDFPAGWPDSDTVRGSLQARQASEYVRQLARWRKDNPVFEHGKFMHFPPSDGVYVYFRYTSDRTVMVAVNTSGQPKSCVPAQYTRDLGDFREVKQVFTDQRTSPEVPLQLPAGTAVICELQR